MSGFSPALSSDGRNSSREDFGWFHPCEAVSRTRVELASYGRQVCACDVAQVGPLGEVLTK
jgi:hypothetical protein